MTITAQSAIAGIKGFDCNAIVRAADVERLVNAGHRFAIRYVSRVEPLPHDITSDEFQRLVNAGLGVMLVQHVERDDPPWWTPTAAKGASYGDRAAENARNVGYPAGATLWLDLEGIVPTTDASVVIAYANAWHDRVGAAGFQPGVYVGYGAILSPTELFQRLRFSRYWGALNLNVDQYPAVRGLCMKQHEAVGEYAPPPGLTFAIDVNTISGDNLHGLPMLAALEQPLPG